MIRASLGILTLSLLASSVAHAEETGLWGETEYMRYCSACHGENADGAGPVANVLTPRPPALRSLHARFGKPLGTGFVEFVSGTTMPRAHGTSDMPVWGRVLTEKDPKKKGDESDPADVLWRITIYLEKIQSDD
jgi:mono/diheme cytochrome c family protein